jgi:hypothetical protein
MIKLNIDVTKIPKDRIQTKPEWKGKFLNLVLVDKPNDRGDDGFISCDVSREEREAGVKGVIVGNWKHVGGARSAPKPANQPAPKPRTADPDLDPTDEPFPF